MDKLYAQAGPNRSVKELQHLGFTTHTPTQALQPWLEFFWSINAVQAAPSEETLYPDGGSSLIFNFEAEGREGVWLHTAQSLVKEIYPSAVSRMGIRFLPGAAYALLGIDKSILTHPVEQAVSSQQLCGIDELFRNLKSCTSQERIAVLEEWLLQIQSAGRDIEPITRLCQRLQRVETEAVEDLQGQGLSRRQLERMFREYTGLSPNQFKMMWRIKYARYLIKNTPQQALTDVALQCHYFDQAHFNRHFKRCVGSTPGQYRQRQLDRLRDQQMLPAAHRD